MRPTPESITGHENTDGFDDALNELSRKLSGRELSDDERRELLICLRERIEAIAKEARSKVNRTTRREGRSVWTPPELAREWGVSPEKILNWIRSGELAATNIAASTTGRPRYRIDAEAITAFKLKRTPESPTPVVRRKRSPPSDVIQFF